MCLFAAEQMSQKTADEAGASSLKLQLAALSALTLNNPEAAERKLRMSDTFVTAPASAWSGHP